MTVDSVPAPMVQIPENTYIRPNGNRACNECRRASNRKWAPKRGKSTCQVCGAELLDAHMARHRRLIHGSKRAKP